MKKSILLLTATLGFAAAIPGYAQFSPGGGGGNPDGALQKIFGTNLNFSANMAVDLKSPEPDSSLAMTGKIYFSGGDSRTEMNMANMKSARLQPQAIEQMKAMGMSQVVSISLPASDTLYMIYPDLEAYAKIPVHKKTDADKDAQVEKTELGRETVDGHPCVKNQYVVTENGSKTTALAWLASDLNNCPVKIQVDSNRPVGGQDVPTTTTLHFTDINTATPAASLFLPPTSYHAYANMQEMMRTEMMKKMGGGMGMPSVHPNTPAQNP